MEREVIDRLKERKYQRKQTLRYLRQLNQEALKQRFMKKLTILHSNDLHGDFLAEEIEQNGQPIQLARDAANVLEEYLESHTITKKDEEPRLVIK